MDWSTSAIGDATILEDVVVVAAQVAANRLSAEGGTGCGAHAPPGQEAVPGGWTWALVSPLPPT